MLHHRKSGLTDREVESAHLAQSASSEAQRIQLIDLAEMVETTKLVNLQTDHVDCHHGKEHDS